MSHEDIEAALPLYAVGALDRLERQQVDAHLLTGCQACHSELREYQSTAALLPHALPPVAPPDELKARILAATAQPSAVPEAAKRTVTREPPPWFQHIMPPPTLRIMHPAFAALIIIVLAGLGGYAWLLQKQVSGLTSDRTELEAALRDSHRRATELQREAEKQGKELAALREEFRTGKGDRDALAGTLAERENELAELKGLVGRREQEVATLRRAVAQRDEMLTFLRSAQVKVVSLSGLEHAKGAGALLLYDRETKKAFFYGFNLPPLPPGKTYQLWAIVDRPISVGTFAADAGSKGRMVVRNLPDLGAITTFAVSLEPEGGRPQPTGEIYLAGKV